MIPCPLLVNMNHAHARAAYMYLKTNRYVREGDPNTWNRYPWHDPMRGPTDPKQLDPEKGEEKELHKCEQQLI